MRHLRSKTRGGVAYADSPPVPEPLRDMHPPARLMICTSLPKCARKKQLGKTMENANRADRICHLLHKRFCLCRIGLLRRQTRKTHPEATNADALPAWQATLKKAARIPYVRMIYPVSVVVKTQRTRAHTIFWRPRNHEHVRVCITSK